MSDVTLHGVTELPSNEGTVQKLCRVESDGTERHTLQGWSVVGLTTVPCKPDRYSGETDGKLTLAVMRRTDNAEILEQAQKLAEAAEEISKLRTAVYEKDRELERMKKANEEYAATIVEMRAEHDAMRQKCTCETCGTQAVDNAEPA